MLCTKKHLAHSEFLIHPFGNGVKLINPKSNNKILDSLIRIEQLFDLSIHAYFLNGESVIQNISEEAVKVAGYPSVKGAINNTVGIAAKMETARFSMRHDREVITTKKAIIKEVPYVRKKDGIGFPVVSVKFPWYSDNNNVIGIFGCSFIPGIHNIAESIGSLAKIGLFNATVSQNLFVPGKQIGNIYLSEREVTCLKFLVKGCSAKMIAHQLNLSVRTIEHHLENIKFKFNVHSKPDLIGKAFEMGLASISN